MTSVRRRTGSAGGGDQYPNRFSVRTISVFPTVSEINTALIHLGIRRARTRSLENPHPCRVIVRSRTDRVAPIEWFECPASYVSRRVCVRLAPRRVSFRNHDERR